jgi:hypothetical protein
MDYAKYLGINNVLIELKRSNSPKLANLINNYLHSSICELRFFFIFIKLKKKLLSFWILLPTNSILLNCKDCWLVWRNFRTLCNNSNHIFVGLSLTEDLGDEFNSFKQIQRWKAEPVYFLFFLNNFKKKLSFVRIDYSLFVQGEGSELRLTEYIFYFYLIINF